MGVEVKLLSHKLFKHLRATLYVCIFWLLLANVLLISEYLSVNNNKLDGYYGFFFLTLIFLGLSSLIYSMFYEGV
jgi:hypothetical protein